jgi:hypothetical protein
MIYVTYGGAFVEASVSTMQLLEPVLSRLLAAIEAADGEACTFALTDPERGRLQQADGGEALDCLNQLMEIAVHAFPQNRREGSPYCVQDAGFVNWYDDEHRVTRERTGLLALTALETPVGRVDPSRPPEVRYDSPDRVIRSDVSTALCAHLQATLAQLRSSLRTAEAEAASRDAQSSAQGPAGRCFHGAR